MSVEIDASQLKGENRERMKDFLEKKLGVTIEVKGDRLILPESPKVSKTMARKACRWFVGREGLREDYRALSSENGVAIKRLKS
jgi:hypothetical protein